MKVYTKVSRKTVGEDRIAICPKFGCEFISRVKPLKFGFLGFGKYPKCRKHRIPLVYIDERISDFVDAALACLFDKSGLPPSELHESIKSKFLDEFNSYIEGWVYCITVGRGAPIVSHYMDTISNAYLKQLTKKQIKTLKKRDASKPNLVSKAIKEGMNEITIQYTRLLKHLRAHSEILIEHQKLKSLSKSLRNYLNNWQKTMLKRNEIINSSENKHEMTLKEIKFNYDQILNVGICRCLLGLNPESKELKRAKITAFDRFSAYHEFFNEGLTVKFTKSDIRDFYSYIKEIRKNLEPSKFSKQEIEFFDKHGINVSKFKNRWGWLREDLLVPFFLDVLYKKGNKVPTSNDLQNWGYNRFIIILREEYGLTLSDLVELAGKTPNINFKKRKNFSIKEKEFLIKNDITSENLTTRWEWVDLHPDLITEFYKDVLYSINNRVPTSRELKKIGYSQFIEKLRNKRISLSDLAKKCGFKPRSRHQRNISPEDLTDEELQFFRNNNIKVNELTSRWSWMDKNPHLVVIFFEEVIFSFFGYVPTWDELANTEFYYYIQKLSKLDLSYPEVIKKSNHVPNFQFLNNSQKKRIYKTTEFLVNEYLEIGNSSKIPSLLSLAKSNDLNVSDMTFGKYAKKYLIKIYGDEYGNQLYSEMWFNKTLGISNDIIKKINDLVDEYSSKFIQSNKIKHPIPIKDIVEYVIPEISSHTFTKYAKELLVKNYGKQNGNTIYSEMWPSENLATKVGSRLHVLINDLLTKFFNKRGVQYISEPYIYPGRRPDGVLILNKELKLLLKKNKSLLDQIKVRYEDLDNLKAIVLDFTSDISNINCTRKIIKYQHSEILLLIIGTSWYSKKPYKLIHGLNQNLSKVCVIDIGFFTKIIDLSSNLKEELQISLDFAQNYNLDSLNSIKALDKSNLHNTESLRKLLIKEGLIKEKIQEYLDFGLINHPIKNKLTLEDKLTIKNEKIKNKIAIIDIETTGFNRDLDSIIEIGIVELDIKSGQIKSLFNSQVKDINFDISQHIDNTFIKTSGIDIYEISESISIKECEEDLQLIFDNYRCAAYNRTFDFGWLESRGFSIPMKLMDIMRFCIKSFPNCGSFKFQNVYRFITNQPNNFITKYLTRSYYKSNHRAIDDAFCEGELLFYLIKELGFVLTYQSKL